MNKYLKKVTSDPKLVYYAFLIPAISFVILFLISPILYNVNLSFHKVTSKTLIEGTSPFVGLENYINLFTADEFVKIMGNTILFSSLSVAGQLLLGLLLALLFVQDFPGHKLLRGLMLIGWVIPPVVVGIIWRWLLNNELGVVNFLLEQVGLNSIPWLVSPEVALYGVIIVNIWFGLPFNMILLTSGLMNISRELIDAAKVDGTNVFQRVWYIILPLLKPTFSALLVIDLIYTFRGFALIWGMTKGGPVNSTTILPVWSYVEAFIKYNYGLGTAITTLIMGLLIIMCLIYVSTIKGEVS